MRWEDLRGSSNIEDRRGGGGLRMGGGLGLGGLLVVGLLAWATGIDPRLLIGGAELITGNGSQQQQQGTVGAPSDRMGRFVSAVLGSTETVWTGIFQQRGATYQDPTLVLYDGATQTRGCGVGQSAMGPFYCPGDRKVYLDTAFFSELSRRFGAPGEFAEAYVVAHEIGHHVQNLLGILPRVDAARARMSRTDSNALSVRLELQADCFAGVWAYHAKDQGIVETGDVEQALRAASAIGDDRLQEQARGRVVPDSFTHGTSAQRVRWFRNGLARGEPRDCDTLSGQRPL